MTKPDVTIYTDGGSKPNPGPGGWGAVLIFGEHEKELSGGDPNTTNNQMELTAAIMALEALNKPCAVTLYTDSVYLKNGITKWLPDWVKRNWRTANKKPVKNQELWQRLYEAVQPHDITWKWVKGHAGNQHNERVDQLASAEIAKFHPDEADTQLSHDVVIRSTASIGKWAVTIAENDAEREFSGEEDKASAYQMALTSAIAALETLENQSKVEFCTNNENLYKGMSFWIHRWKKTDWNNAEGQPIKHKDLWLRLHSLSKKHKITWKHS